MSDILVHTEAGVMTLTFNRLARKNSITAAMYATLADALEQAQADASVRVVLLQGDETIFSAGNDLGDFLNAPPAGQDSSVFRFLRNIANFPKPLIGAVCGPAVGIGTTLLFHCDLVYAGDNAAFSMPFVNLGLCPEAASSLLAPRMFGYHRAAEALLMGEPFFAEAAQEVGFVEDQQARGGGFVDAVAAGEGDFEVGHFAFGPLADEAIVPRQFFADHGIGRDVLRGDRVPRSDHGAGALGEDARQFPLLGDWQGAALQRVVEVVGIDDPARQTAAGEGVERGGAVEDI